MGCISKCFGFTSSKRHHPYEDEYDHDLQVAIALSRSEQDEIARQKREVSEQLAWAIEESSKTRESSHCPEEERRCPRVQLVDNQQLAKAVQNNLDEKETLPCQLEQRERRDDKIQLEEDQWLAETVQESFYSGGSPQSDENSKAQLDEDEQLAKSIQESLDTECSRQRQEKGKGKEKHAEDQVEEDLHLAVALQESLDTKCPPSICASCNSVIEHGRSVNVLGAVWHPECFCCLACQAPIAVQEFSDSRGRFHKSCDKVRSGRNCYVCKQKFPSIAAVRVYKKHQFWEGNYCPPHENDGTSKCCSCERLEPRGTNFVLLDDGRRLCLECFDSAIMDTYECQALHFDIRDFFESLNLKVEKEFPLLLVESQALNRAKEEEHIDHHYAVVTRGLCLSEEHVVTSVSRGPKKGPDNRLTGMMRESHTLTRTCEVTAILIMYGLPRLLTGSILAHEMMHAWLRLNGYRNLKPELEEGICQVLAHMWLESQTYNCVDAGEPSSSASSSSYSATTSKKGNRPEFERRLVDFFKWQIENNDSPVYNAGFKIVNKTVLNNGLLETVRSWRASRR